MQSQTVTFGQRNFVRILLLICAWNTAMPLPADEQVVDDAGVNRWWEKQKIRFHWGQWDQMDQAGVSVAQRIDHLARCGATVVAETLHLYPDSARHVLQEGGIKYHLETGRVAHEHGIRYFASCYGYDVPTFVSVSGSAAVASQLKWYFRVGHFHRLHFDGSSLYTGHDALFHDGHVFPIHGSHAAIRVGQRPRVRVGAAD